MSPKRRLKNYTLAKTNNNTTLLNSTTSISSANDTFRMSNSAYSEEVLSKTNLSKYLEMKPYTPKRFNI